ncbi:hypothetical protein AAFP35_10250 [Gordonia sp. CPCC 206044]|uniref:hypothetical protein n=1 Tax=Gordonia sp. CPCC 206044 TaxID=3140793 RepID=UPI003AF36CF3
MSSVPAICDVDVLDATEFRLGIDAAYAHLGTLPLPWARHHAVTTLAGTIDGSRPSFSRGYRAALHGFVRGGPRL